jgi:DNA polymerase-3 subunit gamma/tau
METNAYDDVFLRVVRKIINSKIKVKYVLVGKKKEVSKGENDFTKKIVDFFGGEIMK